MDSFYSNIVYFVDLNFLGSFLTVHQFKIDNLGYLQSLNTFEVKNIINFDGKFKFKNK